MNRRLIAIVAGAFVVFLLLWYFLGYSPQEKKLSDAKKRKATADQQAQDLTASIARLKAAQKNEPLQRAQLEVLKSAIPDDPGLGQFILDVNDRATASGIDFVSISPSLPAAAAVTPTAAATSGAAATTAPGATGTTGTAVPVAGAAPAQITVALQVSGGYFQVIDFLNRLSTLPRILVLDTLNTAADANAKLTVGISSRMFVRQVPAGYGPAGAKATGTTASTAVGGATSTTVAGATTTTAKAG